MSDSDPPPQPQPPMQLPANVREPVAEQSPDRLRALAAWANELADWKTKREKHERAQRLGENEQGNEQHSDNEDQPDPPDEVVEEVRERVGIPPSKGYTVIKTIDGRDYYYFQWREGDSVMSEYMKPVVPADDE